MAQFIYIDETGSPGTGSSKQPFLTLVGVSVDESKVRDLSEDLKRVAWDHLGSLPARFEFHGYEIWQGENLWAKKTPPELIAAYEDAIGVLDRLDLDVAYSSIHKDNLRKRYNGLRDAEAYRLALQFLLEKVDSNLGQGYKILVADEAKQEQFEAISMVAEMQDWGGGAVPGKRLTSVIDSLHFVRSDASPGVQVADMAAYVLQRNWHGFEKHPDAGAAMKRMYQVVLRHARTWREPWPP